jgi:hypothetical protein
VFDSSDSGYAPVAGSFDHCNKLSGSTNGREFLEELSDYELLKELVCSEIPTARNFKVKFSKKR